MSPSCRRCGRLNVFPVEHEACAQRAADLRLNRRIITAIACLVVLGIAADLIRSHYRYGDWRCSYRPCTELRRSP